MIGSILGVQAPLQFVFNLGFQHLPTPMSLLSADNDICTHHLPTVFPSPHTALPAVWNTFLSCSLQRMSPCLSENQMNGCFPHSAFLSTQAKLAGPPP